ncbi:MAG: exo-alpha-sialidase [Opitutales bacterium]|nr:exo-alpha-sialidase [Opitutales bacterium]
MNSLFLRSLNRIFSSSCIALAVLIALPGFTSGDLRGVGIDAFDQPAVLAPSANAFVAHSGGPGTGDPASPLSGSIQWKNLDLRGMGFVTGILTHPVTGEIYTRTDVGGIFRWDPSAVRWIALLDDFGNTIADTRNVESFALDPANPNRIFVAYGAYVEASTGDHGILRSDDKGLTWVVTNFPGNVRMGGNSQWRHAGERLAVDPANSNVVYFGSRQNGLWRSLDGGMNWSQIAGVPTGGNNGATRNGLPVNGGITFVTISPAATTAEDGPLRSATVYIGIMEVGVYRSTDGGNTFALLGTQPASNATPLQGKLASDETLYVTLNNAVWRWRSGVWTVITPPVPGFTYSARQWAAVAIDPTDPNRLAINDFNNTPRDLFVSADAGATWIIYTTDPAYAFPPGRHRAVSFKIPAWIREADQAFTYSGAITFAPGNPDQIWLTTGYAVYVYESLSVSPVIANAFDFMAGLEELVGTRVLPLPASAGGGVVAGVMDKGGFVIRDPEAIPASHFGSAAIANSTGIGISAQTNTIVLSLASGSFSQGEVIASDDGGQTWRTLSKPFATHPPSGYGMTLGGDIAVSATDPNTIVWIPLNPSWYPNQHPPVHSTDGGATWSTVAGLPDSFNGVSNPYFGANNVLAADTVNGSVFYAYHENLSTFAGSIYRSTDGGATWSVRNNGGLPGYWRSILQARPGTEGELWYSNTVSTLRRSTDGGATFAINPGWTTVSAFGFGAPHPGESKNTIYALGTRDGLHGLYYSVDDGLTWTRPTGLGPAPLNMMSSVSGDLSLPGRIYAASTGRGLFYVDLFGVASLSGYDAWALEAFPEGTSEEARGPFFDFDGDGLVNIIEYALGTDPSEASRHPGVEIVQIEGGAYLQLQWTRPNDRSGITLYGEVSADLSPDSWTSDAMAVSVVITQAGPEEETVTIRDLTPISASTPRFLRLRVGLGTDEEATFFP